MIQHSEAELNAKFVETAKLLRTAPSAEFELWNAYVEDYREWSRLQKTELWTH